MATLTQIINSKPFCNLVGTPVAYGVLSFSLRGGGLYVPGSGYICNGIAVQISLDVNGKVVISPAQYLWANNSIQPAGSTYTMKLANQAGLLVFGPVNIEILQGSTFDLSSYSYET
jgi:hypothetical protein